MEPLAERLFRDTIGAFEIFAVYVGERLGLYICRRGSTVRPSEPLDGVKHHVPRRFEPLGHL
jgi:hypothetical protein